MSDKQLKQLRKKLRQDRADALKAALSTADGGGVTTEVENEFALERFGQLDRRLKALPKVEKIREPGPYDRGSRNGIVADAIAAAAITPLPGMEGAQARLAQLKQDHQRRKSVESRLAERRMAALGVQARGDSGAPIQQRVGDLSTTAGAGGEFVHGVYPVDQGVFIDVARGAAPFIDLAGLDPLPDGCNTVVYSQFETGSGVAPDTENTATPDALNPSTHYLTSAVVMLSGQVEVSQQWLDQGPALDRVVFRSMGASFGSQFQTQLITGSGVGEELLGVANVPGVVSTTYTSATPSVAGLVTAIGQTAAQVADARRLVPEAVFMRGARYFWMSSEPDSQGDPIQRPGTGGFRPKNSSGPFGPVLGLPVWTTDSVPANLGTGTNQDEIIVCRPSDFMLFASQPTFTVMPETVGNTLTAIVEWHAYVAAITSAYPGGIGVLGGTGLVVQTGF
jgi:HK97 family phage major capsid protein